jgi:hypothetical protein
VQNAFGGWIASQSSAGLVQQGEIAFADFILGPARGRDENLSTRQAATQIALATNDEPPRMEMPAKTKQALMASLALGGETGHGILADTCL